MKALRKGLGCHYAGKVSTHVLPRLMRHANISTTMGYYPNVDDAVEAAILGEARQRNTLRNRDSVPDASPAPTSDASSEPGSHFD
jgi:hypothetical protein